MSQARTRRPRLVSAVGVLVVAVAVVVVIVLARRASDSASARTPAPPASSGVADPTQDRSAPDTGSSTQAGEPSASPRAKVSQPKAPQVATESPSPAATHAPRTFSKPARFGDGVTASVVRAELVKGTGRGPGEISGPAVRVTLRVRNGSSSSINLTRATVNAYYGRQKTPAPPLTGDESVRAFHGNVPKGGVSVGVYVFQVPRGADTRLRVELSYGPSSSIVTFTGAAQR